MVIRILICVLILLLNLLPRVHGQKAVEPSSLKPALAGKKIAGNIPAPQPQSFRFIHPEFSPSGRWIVVRRFLDESSTSLVVLDSEKKKAGPVLTADKLRYEFTANDYLLLADQSSAELWNLKQGNKKSFANVKNFAVNRGDGTFALLGQDAVVRWYSFKGDLLSEVPNVTGFYQVPNGNPYFSRKVGSGTELWTLGGTQPVKVYETINRIERIAQLPNESEAVITEWDAASGHQSLMLVKAGSAPKQILHVPAQAGGVFLVWPMADGRLMILKTENVRSTAGGEPQVLYSGSHDLEDELEQRKKVRKSWIWDGQKAERIPLEESIEVIPTGHPRYVLNYHPTELQDYKTFSPRQKLKLLDLETGQQHDIGTRMPAYNRSRDGRFIVFRNDKGRWQVSDVHDPFKKPLLFSAPTGIALRTPLFTQDSSGVIFESSDGLWQYSVRTQQLTRIPFTSGYLAEVINRTGSSSDPQLQNDQAYADLTLPVLAKLRDTVHGRTSFVSWDGKKARILLSPTDHSVQYFNQKEKATVWTQEFYNSAPRLMYRDRSGGSRVLLNNPDPTAAGVRRDIVHFTGSAGEALKGVLYYPTGYTEGLKYPMVVHLYQVQNHSANVYIRQGERTGTGIDIRLLQDNGYFVFLPDTVVNPDIGSGKSALYCVHAALDALATYKDIDRTRIGLTGHSFGGYETNFIATQSDRFAAYISGAGISDIFYDYYSIAWHYTKPSYWVLETNQHNFRKDFASAKELYTANNPIWFADRVNRPVLLWTGKKDMNVHWEQTLNFYLGLRRYNKTVVALLYPESRHNLNTTEALDFRQRALEWWDYWLKDKKEVEWIERLLPTTSEEVPSGGRAK